MNFGFSQGASTCWSPDGRPRWGTTSSKEPRWRLLIILLSSALD
jgi:hypothetical protein